MNKMSRVLTLSLLGQLTLLWCSPAGAIDNDRRRMAVSPDDGVIKLFDGESLKGLTTWLKDTQHEDPRNVFRVTNGMLHITGNGLGAAITEKEYRDYHLVLEFKWGPRTWAPRTAKARDSGLLVHSTGAEGGYNGIWMPSIEVQIIEGGMGDFILVTGDDEHGKPVPLSITCHTDRDRDGEVIWKKDGKQETFDVQNRQRVNWYGRDPEWQDVLGYRGERDPDSPMGEWNRMDVVCDGGHIVVTFNGQKVNEAVNCYPSFGKIQLQSELAEVFVRRWELRPLTKKPSGQTAFTDETQRETYIQPDGTHPFYWQYKGEPVLLLGASDDDNLFQMPDLQEHLEKMQQVGANYIRNTMSDRANKGFEVYPFKKLPSGKYDLNQWNEEYWSRFNNMLQWTFQRDIVVQIEVWDRFDYSDHRKSNNWRKHPYNPRNNRNYTSADTNLKPFYGKHPGANEQPFFFSVPQLNDNQRLLRFQEAQVDKMLSYALAYPHVLYCIDNETGGSPDWGAYWANRIRQRARDAGVDVHVTEMWDAWDLAAPQHQATFDHPEIYSFVDISQNNHQKGQRHWDNAQRVRHRLAAHPRPMNNVKIYGADGGPFGSNRDGLERFWRNIVGGAASSRFHRPEAGLGLGPETAAHIKSMRLLTRELDIVRCLPDSGCELLAERHENEAYATRVPGEQYAVYFPDGGRVELDLTQYAAVSFAMKWLDIAASAWQPEHAVTGGGPIVLTAPGKGHWAVLVHRVPGP